MAEPATRVRAVSIVIWATVPVHSNRLYFVISAAVATFTQYTALNANTIVKMCFILFIFHALSMLFIKFQLNALACDIDFIISWCALSYIFWLK
jgi:hypothetical protein